MIGSLRGTLLEKHPPLLLVDVQGVGYEVHAPMTTFYQLPALGSDIHLHTHFVVREDAQLLYGFIDKSTRELFRELIRINGLGPKMALAILSALDASELVLCIQNNQINTLTKVPGIGRKTAERLLVTITVTTTPNHSPTRARPQAQQHPPCVKMQRVRCWRWATNHRKPRKWCRRYSSRKRWIAARS